jgi:pSer/pThr/pTyr-binding forkhead associated (FHA) protein
MQVVLVSFRAEGEKRSFSVVRDMTVIGRREDCDLRIPVSEVSRKHCRIIKDGDQLRVEDLGSSNGTYHNGQRVQGAAVLSPGDSVQVGPVVFVVQIDGEPPEDELAPFAERAAHQLDDSVSEAATAAAAAGAISTAEVDPHAIEENLDLLEEMPAEPDLDDELGLLDESAAPVRPAAPTTATADEPDPLELLENEPAPIPLDPEGSAIDFDMLEEEQTINKPIPMSEEDDLLEIPMDLELEDETHDSEHDAHKHPGR